MPNPGSDHQRDTSPPLICMTGIDGCGKSTQVRRLTERMRDHGFEVESAWSGGRPYISRPIQRLAKRWLPRQDPDDEAQPALEQARSGQPDNYTEYLSATNRLLRRHWILRRGWTDISLLEHALEARFTVGPHLKRGSAVVCDRYTHKSIVNLAILLDLQADRLPRLLRHPALRLAPPPTIYFLLDLPAEVAYERKYDLPSIEYIRRRVPIYRALAELTDMTVIDATRDIDEVSDAIWHITQERLGLPVSAVSAR